ncbi:MAG: LamG domain-containing protein [Akkermansiaceae bacterium]|nr:LamG domain-containing protein [Akkermansiaceae bacterium]
MKKTIGMTSLIVTIAASIGVSSAQDVPASVLTQLVHYSSLDNDAVGAGSGTDTSSDGVFSVGATIGVAGSAGGSANTTPGATTASHLTSGASGQLFEGLSFPGGENAGVRFDGVAAPGTANYAVSFWFNFQDSAQNGILAGSGNPGSSAEGWTVFYENGSLIFRISVGGGGADLRAAVNGPVTNDSDWHHAVLMIDQTAGVVRGFIDGLEVTGVGSGGPPDETFVADADGIANGDPVLLGARASGGFQFFGAMDDFAVWDRTLTTAEVTGIYDAGVAGNPLVSKDDTDGDGMPNAYEEQFPFLNPNDAGDAGLDEDNDTLTNLEECNQGTNPGLADSDDDGLDDNEETTTNPLVADSDGDGLKDGPEIEEHMTDPNIADSDGDNLSDGVEVNDLMTDPNKEDSDDDTFNDDVEVASGTDPNDDQSFPTIAVNDGLYLYYNFDGSSITGDVIDDLAGNEAGPFDGTKANGGPTEVSGLFGEAAEFLGGGNGDMAQYVDLNAHAAALGALSEGSISAWVKVPSDALLTDVLTIFAMSDDLDGSSESRFWVSNGGGFGTGTLAYGVRNDAANQGTFNSGAISPLLDGEWHHVATTFVEGSSTATLYIDGDAVGSASSVFFAGVDGANAASIGRNSDSSGSQWFFDGSMDDFAIWDRPLNALEIAHIYSEGLAGKPLAPGAASDLKITSIVRDGVSGDVSITWNSRNGVNYELEASTDLNNWESIDDVSATGQSTTIVDSFFSNGKPKVFYRIIVAN